MTEQTALSRLAELCSRGEHCAGELNEKMRRWGLDEEAQGRIVAYLTAHHYIDEERFVRAFVHDKLEYDHWGQRKIAQALRLKGVSTELVDRILDETGPESYEKKLRPLLAQKRRSIKARDERELTMKLIRFAMGRGYTYDQIRHCLPDADDL